MIYFKLLTFALFLNILLGAGAQAFSVNIAGFPLTITDALLFVGLLRHFARGLRGGKIEINKRDAILIILAFVSLFRALYDVFARDTSAIRDCTHYMDMLFVLVVYSEMSIAATYIDLQEYFHKFFLITKNAVFFYALLLPFSDTIVAISPQGMGAQSAIPIFGSFTITHLWLLIIALMDAYMLVNEKVEGNRKYYYYFQILVSLVLMVYTSSRITLITLGVLFILGCFQFRGKISSMIFGYFVIGCILLGILAIAGVSLSTSRGTFTIQSILDLIRSAFGDESAGYDGVSLRSEFFTDVLSSHNTIDKILFGGGFGYALISFGASNGATVREPHCGYLSVYARNGIIYLIIWISYLLRNLIYAFKNAEKSIYYYLLFIVMIASLLNAACETFFETPCEASVFYMLLAICNFLGENYSSNDIQNSVDNA